MKQAFLTEELATLLRVQSHTCAPSSAWETKADRAAAVSRFHPQRPPGVHVEAFSVFFFAIDTVSTICSYTNKNAAKNKELWKNYTWTDIEEDLHKFFTSCFTSCIIYIMFFCSGINKK